MTITIAINGILSVITMVSYHIQKMHLISVYEKLNHLILLYQILVEGETKRTDFNKNGLNIPKQTRYYQFTVNAPAKSVVTSNIVTCIIQNLPCNQSDSINLGCAADGP